MGVGCGGGGGLGRRGAGGAGAGALWGIGGGRWDCSDEEGGVERLRRLWSQGWGCREKSGLRA